MFISGGVNIYPAEIENALLQHPDVHDAAVVGLEHETWGEVGVAWVVPAPDRTVTGDDLAAFIVPRDAQGLVVGEVERKMGLHGLTTTGLELERVEVGRCRLRCLGGRPFGLRQIENVHQLFEHFVGVGLQIDPAHVEEDVGLELGAEIGEELFEFGNMQLARVFVNRKVGGD